MTDDRRTRPVTGEGAGDGGTAPIASGALAPGTMVGSHRIEGLLGQGGMAAVYRAVDTRLGRAVAVKVMARSLAPGIDAARRFLREARMLAGVSHPNLVCVYEAGECPAGPYLVMELLAGETLAARVAATGRIDPRTARAWIAKLAEALEVLHSRGVVHRDVKPANILLTADRGPVLADFGLARPAAGDLAITAPGLVFGTPEYMSPEQARGEPLDARSDLYALGTVWYELVTGRPPFGGRTMAAILRQQVQSPPPPVPDGVALSAADRELLLACLAKEREKRPARAGDLARALEGPVSVPGRGHGTRWRWAALPALLLAAIAGYVLRREGGESRPPVEDAAPFLPSDRVARWLQTADLAAFLADFAPGPLSPSDRRRVERDLARVETAWARVERAPDAFPATGRLARARLAELAARDRCLLGDVAAARSALATAEDAASGEERMRLARLSAAVEALFPPGAGRR